jgi:hypothetical protein
MSNFFLKPVCSSYKKPVSGLAVLLIFVYFYWECASLHFLHKWRKETFTTIISLQVHGRFGFAIVLIPILGLQMLPLFLILIVDAICISRY